MTFCLTQFGPVSVLTNDQKLSKWSKTINIDMNKAEQFAGQVVGDIVATAVCTPCSLSQELGLSLGHGPEKNACCK